MAPKTFETTVYKFNELTDKIQNRIVVNLADEERESAVYDSVEAINNEIKKLGIEQKHFSAFLTSFPFKVEIAGQINLERAALHIELPKNVRALQYRSKMKISCEGEVSLSSPTLRVTGDYERLDFSANERSDLDAELKILCEKLRTHLVCEIEKVIQEALGYIDKKSDFETIRARLMGRQGYFFENGDPCPHDMAA